MQRRHNLNPALRHNRALDAKTTISRIGGQMTEETVKNGTEALFTREGMPPVKEMIPCALQHVLASFAGIITPAVIMAGVYGFNSQQSTDIIEVALILSAIDTALQAFAPFRRIGGGLPIVMGVSFAFSRPSVPWVPRALALVRCWAARSSAAPSRSSLVWLTARLSGYSRPS